MSSRAGGNDASLDGLDTIKNLYRFGAETYQRIFFNEKEEVDDATYLFRSELPQPLHAEPRK